CRLARLLVDDVRVPQLFKHRARFHHDAPPAASAISATSPTPAPTAPSLDSRIRSYTNLFNACTYARALASMTSVLVPRPLYTWPLSCTCTVTSPKASLPPVTAFKK